MTENDKDDGGLDRKEIFERLYIPASFGVAGVYFVVTGEPSFSMWTVGVSSLTLAIGLLPGTWAEVWHDV